MAKETKMILAMVCWGMFLASVAEAILGSQEFLIQGMIAWVVGTLLVISGIKDAKRG